MTERDVIIVEENDAELVRRLADEHGITAERLTVRGIEPVSTVTFVLLGAATAIAVVVQLVEKHKGGQVIDLRPGAPKAFYRSPDVIYGLVVLIAADGKVVVDVKEPRDMFGTVIDALQRITVDVGTAGVEAIAAAASQELGEVATVSVETSTGGHPDS